MSNEEQEGSIVEFVDKSIEELRKHYLYTQPFERDYRVHMMKLAEFIMNKYNLNPLFPGNTTKPKGFQRALYAVTAELKALRETIDEAATRLRPKADYSQEKQAAPATDPGYLVVKRKKIGGGGWVWEPVIQEPDPKQTRVEIASSNPEVAFSVSPAPTIRYHGRDYVFTGEENYQLTSEGLVYTGTFKLKEQNIV